MQAYSVRVYGGACIVCCLCTVVRNVYGMFNILRVLYSKIMLYSSTGVLRSPSTRVRLSSVPPYRAAGHISSFFTCTCTGTALHGTVIFCARTPVLGYLYRETFLLDCVVSICVGRCLVVYEL